MTELFESTIDNVSELEIRGYSDPVIMERTMEIWAKRGDEEYVYKFTGPGVDKFKAAADGRCWKENKKLKEAYEKLHAENQKLKELKTPTIENFADEEPRTRADILDQAEKCVCGQREQDYGTPESNFQLIADLWNGYLGFMDHPQDQIRATDVAMMMALMKIARIRNGGGSGDSFVDLAGYAACGGEIWHGERHSNA